MKSPPAIPVLVCGGCVEETVKETREKYIYRSRPIGEWHVGRFGMFVRVVQHSRRLSSGADNGRSCSTHGYGHRQNIEIYLFFSQKSNHMLVSYSIATVDPIEFIHLVQSIRRYYQLQINISLGERGTKTKTNDCACVDDVRTFHKLAHSRRRYWSLDAVERPASNA